MSSDKPQKLVARYGIPNLEMLVPWINKPAEDDGPFWALNLMKYREVADYGNSDLDAPKVSGRDADNAYFPIEAITGVGAKLVFVADVIRQTGSEPLWDRIAIVQYPTRSSFMAMQLRDDFKSKHVHKDAGMEVTIVAATNPISVGELLDVNSGTLTLRVARLSNGAQLPECRGAKPVAQFAFEGVIIGDERTWSRASFDFAPTDSVLEELLSPMDAAEESFSFALGNFFRNSLQESIIDSKILER